MASKTEEVYTNGYHPSVLKSHGWRTAENSCPHLLPKLKEMAKANPNLTLLDVGCGSGSITTTLAPYMPDGHLTGLDLTEEPLAYARDIAAKSGITNVTFQTGSIFALPFPDATFDIIHVSQVITHLKDQISAVRELYRVCKPGSIVAVREGLINTYSIWPDDGWFSTFIGVWRGQMETQVSDVSAGRKLRAMFLEIGAEEEDLKSSASCWAWAEREDREMQSETIIERVEKSSFAEYAERQGVTKEKVAEIVEGWRRWAKDPAGWMSIMNAEIVVTKR